MENKSSTKERVFTAELASKRNLKNVMLTNGSSDSVLIEGTIGEFVHASFADGVILEVVGKHGILRVDLREGEIQKSKSNSRMEATHL